MIFSLVCFLLLPIGIIAANKVKNLVVFGDSYSDVGNFQRWTNGPVWSEHVTAGWNASLHSFAYSGAVCDNALFPNNTSTYYNTPSIQDQVEFYYQQHMNLDPSETVFAFWVGVNDIHHAFKEQPVVPDFNIISNCVIEQIKIIHRIFKANQIMLINLPPMEFMPYFVESTMATSRGAAVRMVNKGLKKQVEELNKKYRTLELDLVDIHSLLSDMVNDPTSFGISNKDRAYWDDCQGDCKGLEMDDYLWWDRTHLTGRVHHVIGNSILNAGSYYPPTSVNKIKVEKLLFASESNIRSPIYRAPPNTGMMKQLINEMDTPHNDPVQSSIDNEEKKHSIRLWIPLLLMMTLAVTGGLFWIKKRRNNRGEHQLLKNEDTP